MLTCIFCRFVYPLDEVALRRLDSHRCICRGCFARETDTATPMPKALRSQLRVITREPDTVA